MDQRGRSNNFDLIRLLAATQVVVFHGIEHLQIGLTGIAATLAAFGAALPGVPIFFVVSGYLISMSFERQGGDIGGYARNRFLRIYPALWVALAVGIATIFVFDRQLGHVSLPRFAIWIAAQISFFQNYNPDFLRTYATGVLNGSLWTIPVELEFYIVLPVIYAALRLRRGRYGDYALFVLLALATAFAVNFDARLAGHPLSTIEKVVHYSVLPYLYVFLIGVVLQRQAATIRRFVEGRALWWIAAYAVVAGAATRIGLTVGTNEPFFVTTFVLAFAVIACAYTSRDLASRLLRGNDISYGTYVYHMLIINVLVENRMLHVGTLVVAVLLGTFALAALSWIVVERPALSLKGSRRIPEPVRVAV